MHQLPLSSPYRLFAAALFSLGPMLGQTTTDLTFENLIASNEEDTGVTLVSGSGAGNINPLGTVALTLNGTQTLNNNGPAGPIQGTFTFSWNALDSFSVPVSIPDLPSATFSGSVSGGTGAYSGATGALTFVITKQSQTGANTVYSFTGSGNLSAGQTTTAVTLVSFGFRAAGAKVGSSSVTATGAVAPFGNVTMNVTTSSTDDVSSQGTAVFTFNPSDSFTLFFRIENANQSPVTLASTVMGGTGMFAGATGSATLMAAVSQSTITVNGSGTITVPAAGAPKSTITSVSPAFTTTSNISQNTFIQIKGVNLVPGSTPAEGVIWSDAPEFLDGRMPTQLGGVSVTVNGKPAYVYFFCSAATSPACSSDQINVLTPLDNAAGQVLVAVTSGTVSSQPFIVNMQAVSPAFLLFSTKGYIVATHSDYTLLGPTNLYPGLSTPAGRLETVLLYAVGFGLPTTPLVDGSSSQFGNLETQPACRVGIAPATVTVVLVAPGLYAFALTVPDSAVSGDNVVTCSYNGAFTQAGALLSVE